MTSTTLKVTPWLFISRSTIYENGWSFLHTSGYAQAFRGGLERGTIALPTTIRVKLHYKEASYQGTSYRKFVKIQAEDEKLFNFYVLAMKKKVPESKLEKLREANVFKSNPYSFATTKVNGIGPATIQKLKEVEAEMDPDVDKFVESFPSLSRLECQALKDYGYTITDYQNDPFIFWIQPMKVHVEGEFLGLAFRIPKKQRKEIALKLADSLNIGPYHKGRMQAHGYDIFKQIQRCSCYLQWCVFRTEVIKQLCQENYDENELTQFMEDTDVFNDDLFHRETVTDENGVENMLVAMRKDVEQEKTVANSLLSQYRRKLKRSHNDDKHVTFDQSLNEKQRHAVAKGVGESLSIINGAAGVGKTFTIKAICAAIKRKEQADIALLAPTGKAVMVMKSKVQENITEYSTIHSFIYRPRQFPNPLTIIVDEMSMVGLNLLHRFCTRVINDKKPRRVIFIGDDAQLQSIESGAVFRDMLKSSLPKTTLTEICRNSGNIVEVATAIRSGRMPNVDPNATDVCFIQNHAEIYKKFLSDVAKNPFHNKVLVATNRTGKTINEEIQKLKFGNKKKPFTNVNPITSSYYKDYRFYVGDCVINCKNIIETTEVEEKKKIKLLLANGAEGTIIKIDKDEIVVRYDSCEEDVKYTSGDGKSLLPAYSLTYHKSQGSEYKNVLCYIENWMKREHAYVGITRATEKAIIFDFLNQLQSRIAESEQNRHTRLDVYINKKIN